ncbi:hypothetical protein M0805_009373 [Coniferiporia weirii]|nr:hypothetical protein M0805_009373 [Coniferiporia weirii]
MSSTNIFQQQKQQSGQQQQQPHKRTRSQLQLPVLSIEFARSPLKDAREARRKANIVHKSPLTLSNTRVDDGRDGIEGEKDGMEETRHISGDELPPEEPSLCMDTQSSIEDEILLSPSKSKSTSSNARQETIPVSKPVRSKRSRSPSFEDVFGNADGNEPDATRFGSSLDGSTSKRTKLRSSQSAPTQGTRGPLDAFFSRQPAKQSKESRPKYESPPEQIAHPLSASTMNSSLGTRRIFSGGVGASPLPPSDPLAMVSKPVVPATPTIKQLKSLPMLDLRTMTPSPIKSKAGLGVGKGTPFVSRLRAVSEGTSIRFQHVDCTEDGENNGEGRSIETKEEVQLEAKDIPLPSSSPPPQDIPSPSPPRAISDDSNIGHEPTSAPPSRSEAMEIQATIGSSAQNDENDVPEVFEPLTITVTAEAGFDDSKNPKPKAPSKDTPEIADGPQEIIMRQPRDTAPTTPHTQNPRSDLKLETVASAGSKSKNTESLPSTFFSMSPLTPLPRGKGSDEDYEYEEEEKAMEVIESFQVTSGSSRAQLVPIVFSPPARSKSPTAETEKPNQGLNPSNDDPFAVTSSTSAPPPAPPSSSKHNASKLKPTFSKAGVATSASKTKSSAIVRTGKAATAKRPPPLATTTPRMRLTRAAVLRQKHLRSLANASPSRAKPRISQIQGPSVAAASSSSTEVPSEKNEETKKDVRDEKINVGSPKRKGPGDQKKVQGKQEQSLQKLRKSFVLTIPSSLSPLKGGGVPQALTSTSSAAPSSFLSSKPRPSIEFPSKPFTFSLYPPPITDPDAKARAQNALSNLSTALDKLAMPPPAKPLSSIRGPQDPRPRPSTSLGFSREMSAPVMARQGQESAPRPLSRAGSIGPTKRTSSFLPPPPQPLFTRAGDKGKAVSKPGGLPPSHFSFGGSGTLQSSGFGSAGRGIGSGFGRGGIFGKQIPRIRASQKTSLETVEGSPVKGGAASMRRERDNDDGDGDVSMASLRSATIRSTPDHSPNEKDSSVVMDTDGERAVLGNAESPDDSQTTGKEKELKKISKLNASRRASMAFSALTQSLSTPTPNSNDKGKIKSIVSDGPLGSDSPVDPSPAGKRLQRAASATYSSSRPVRAAAMRSFVSANNVTPLGRTRSQSEAVAPLSESSTAPTTVGESDGEGKSGRKSAMGRSKMPGSLDVLDRCTIFVDVRTEEGEDAGGLFVDMLRSLGAKVPTRVGQTCTHIVYKNGLASTSARWKLLDEPRPSVVGIGWVVECAEKREQVDVTRFQVDLDNVNVAGTLKRRRSILPKQMSMSGPMDTFLSGTTHTDSANAGVDSDPLSESGATSQDHGNTSGNSLRSSTNYNPLEQARKRSVMFPRPLNG